MRVNRLHDDKRSASGDEGGERPRRENICKSKGHDVTRAYDRDGRHKRDGRGQVMRKGEMGDRGDVQTPARPCCRNSCMTEPFPDCAITFICKVQAALCESTGRRWHQSEAVDALLRGTTATGGCGGNGTSMEGTQR